MAIFFLKNAYKNKNKPRNIKGILVIEIAIKKFSKTKIKVIKNIPYIKSKL